MSKPKEKHIERLKDGKKSGINLGSRSVPHHLRAHENAQFERAIKTRFMTLKTSDRINLTNIWEKYCEAKNWPLIFCIKKNDGSGEVHLNQESIFSGPLEAAKKKAQEVVKINLPR